jgi:hypothetical protein
VEGSLKDGLPLPFDATCAIRIEWTGAEGRLAVSGSGLSLVPIDEPRFVEKFPGSIAGR